MISLPSTCAPHPALPPSTRLSSFLYLHCLCGCVARKGRPPQLSWLLPPPLTHTPSPRTEDTHSSTSHLPLVLSGDCGGGGAAAALLGMTTTTGGLLRPEHPYPLSALSSNKPRLLLPLSRLLLLLLAAVGGYAVPQGGALCGGPQCVWVVGSQGLPIEGNDLVVLPQCLLPAARPAEQQGQVAAGVQRGAVAVPQQRAPGRHHSAVQRCGFGQVELGCGLGQGIGQVELAQQLERRGGEGSGDGTPSVR